MRLPSRALGAGLVLTCSWIAVSSAACVRRSELPTAVTDGQFWRLIESLSEPPGAFPLSDNLVSNEPHVAENARQLRGTGGVYVGVGPEQNFTYIARLQPAMAFIIDIRRENRDLHLLYKALFELAGDRVDFVSRLFSRAPPPGLDASARVEEIFARYARVPPSPDQYRRNLEFVHDRLLKVHGLPLSPEELAWIDRAFKAFYDDGPDIQFWGSRSVDADTMRPSFRRLMTVPDGFGQSRSFLSTEEAFQFVKDLQSRNMIVPLVGDFGGPSAIRAVGNYVRDHADAVRAFYGSNVGVYLNAQQTQAFCRSLAALPATADAWFIERDGVRTLRAKLKACSP